MTPTFFPEANIVMRAPKGMANCVDVQACKTTAGNNQVIVTAWRPSPEELVKMNLGEPVFLLLYGGGMQPALVTADNPFVQPKDEE